MRRIGYLGPTGDVASHLVQAFRDGLHDHGLVEGRNVVVEWRSTNDEKGTVSDSILQKRAAELVDNGAEVLAVSIDPAVLAARKVARDVPIVMMSVSDPVALGLVASLAHPGGNVTGLSRLGPDIVGKNLQLLSQAVPGNGRIGVLANMANAIMPMMVSNVRNAARVERIELFVVEMKSSLELEDAFAQLRKAKLRALLVPADPLLFTQRARIAEFTLTERLPSMCGYTEHAEAGGLMAYGPSAAENYRRAASFIAKILAGAKPAELPVEQPTTFQFVINLRAAKTMGVSVSPSTIARADRVID
jgi:putative ABC transport system substrate-binding protein